MGIKLYLLLPFHPYIKIRLGLKMTEFCMN